MPTSTWFGGIDCVPSALRMNPSTIRIRVKLVITSTRPGSSVTSPSSSSVWTEDDMPFACSAAMIIEPSSS